MTDSQPIPPIATPVPAYAPRAVRPPLTARAKRGAAIAGAVGFVLLSLGYAMVAIPVALALFVGFIALIVRSAGSAALESGAEVEQFFASIDLTPWVVPLVVIVLVGAVVMAGAIVLSGRVLSAHGVRRPWAVTWAGAGIAIVASWILGGIVGFVSSLVANAVNYGSSSWGAGLIPVALASGLAGLAANAVVGWLSWWWMAHALRPGAPVADDKAPHV